MQILAIEFLNYFRRVGKINSRNPSLFAHFITLLLNKILQFFIIDARIKDFGDFEFFFAINLN